MNTSIISAICTPLVEDDSLHVEGLAAHLEDQWRHGIAGVVVGGTMGLMQLLPDETYRDLVRHAVRLTTGRGELLVGAGDASYGQTLRRIQYIEQFPVDGILILPPFFFPLTQPELVQYFRSLADQSRRPVYLYDQPARTRTKLEMETVLELAKHPNIRGIKCSGDWRWTRYLMDRVNPGFRVVPAEAELVDMLIRCGVRDNLDGIFSVVPGLTMSIVKAAEQGNWEEAAARQGELFDLLTLLRRRYPVFPACAALLNAQGIPGRCFPRPMQPLEPDLRDELLNEPLVRQILGRAINRSTAGDDRNGNREGARRPGE